MKLVNKEMKQPPKNTAVNVVVSHVMRDIANPIMIGAKQLHFGGYNTSKGQGHGLLLLGVLFLSVCSCYQWTDLSYVR